LLIPSFLFAADLEAAIEEACVQTDRDFLELCKQVRDVVALLPVAVVVALLLLLLLLYFLSLSRRN
jgi:hypothetical protein